MPEPITYADYYAKRDQIHDLVCEHFNTGSDDGLPVGDAVMEALYGPPPDPPAPEFTKDALRMRVVDYADVPIGISTCEASESVYLSISDAEDFARRLGDAAAWCRVRTAGASGGNR